METIAILAYGFSCLHREFSADLVEKRPCEQLGSPEILGLSGSVDRLGYRLK